MKTRSNHKPKNMTFLFQHMLFQWYMQPSHLASIENKTHVSSIEFLFHVSDNSEEQLNKLREISKKQHRKH
jgi:hypothetical protein